MKWQGVIREEQTFHHADYTMKIEAPDIISAAMILWGQAFEFEAQTAQRHNPISLEAVIEEREEDD